MYKDKTGMFEDFNFKLVVISSLFEKRVSFTEELIGMIEEYEDAEIDDYECIPEMAEYFENLKLTEEDLAQVESLVFDGGEDIYSLIMPDWDGEEDDFEVTSIKGFELLKNLKEVEYISMCDEELMNGFIEAGINVRGIQAKIKVTDDVIGELTWDYGYERFEERIILGYESDIRIAIQSYDQKILDVQKEAYKKYIENEQKYTEDVPKALIEYYVSMWEEVSEHFVDIPERFYPENINAESMLELVFPNTIYFDIEGNFGYLCDCGWDRENGLGILLSKDKVRIVDQEELI